MFERLLFLSHFSPHHQYFRAPNSIMQDGGQCLPGMDWIGRPQTLITAPDWCLSKWKMKRWWSLRCHSPWYLRIEDSVCDTIWSFRKAVAVSTASQVTLSHCIQQPCQSFVSHVLCQGLIFCFPFRTRWWATGLWHLEDYVNHVFFFAFGTTRDNYRTVAFTVQEPLTQVFSLICITTK